MMNFGDDADGMSAYFADYPLRLFCVNETEKFSEFHTEIKELFRLMQFHKDKKGLQKELDKNPKYHEMDVETLEVLSVVLDAPRIWDERKKYTTRVEKREECDVCQALREWIEDERNEERRKIVKNMLLRGMSDEDICTLTECGPELVAEVRTLHTTIINED